MPTLSLSNICMSSYIFYIWNPLLSIDKNALNLMNFIANYYIWNYGYRGSMVHITITFFRIVRVTQMNQVNVIFFSCQNRWSEWKWLMKLSYFRKRISFSCTNKKNAWINRFKVRRTWFRFFFLFKFYRSWNMLTGSPIAPTSPLLPLSP